MKVIYSFLLVLFLHSMVIAQENKKQISSGQQPLSTSTVIASSQKTVEPTPVTKDGANLTPEQQGYTKQVINGKDVYIKQQGQMIFYYEPKK
jgi:hypothetical protein